MKVLYVAWQDPEDRRWFTVAQLTRDDGLYRFAYTKGATRSRRFIPFGRMNDLNVVYESQDLFPLFANRLLSKDRPEYRDFLYWLDLVDSENDPLALLARTGGIRETDSLMVFPRPTPTVTGEYVVRFFAQGLRYLPSSAVQAVNELAVPRGLFLMPDPQNEHDQFAMALRTGDPKALVGYCPRYLTGDFHALLQQLSPKSVKVMAERVNPAAPVQLRLLCSVTASWPKEFRPCSGEDYEVLAPAAPRLMHATGT